MSVILRFCQYELEELDSLIYAHGGLSRSTLVNVAIEEFLHSPKEQDFQMCQKRKVNLAVRPDKLNKLTQYAKACRVHRSDLIRLAIRNFKLKYSIEETNGKP